MTIVSEPVPELQADRGTDTVLRVAAAFKSFGSVQALSGATLDLACGVLHEPRVILLDEPTVGVDPQSRERIYEMLGQLRAAGGSLLVTTHHLEEAEARCDRIAIIDHGKLIAAGTLAELIERTVGG